MMVIDCCSSGRMGQKSASIRRITEREKWKSCWIDCGHDSVTMSTKTPTFFFLNRARLTMIRVVILADFSYVCGWRFRRLLKDFFKVMMVTKWELILILQRRFVSLLVKKGKITVLLNNADYHNNSVYCLS